MKSIFETFVSALVLGLVIYVVFMAFQNQNTNIKTKDNIDQRTREAEKATETVKETNEKVQNVIRNKQQTTPANPTTPPASSKPGGSRTSGSTTNQPATTPPANTSSPAGARSGASGTQPAATSTNAPADNSPFFIQLGLVKENAYNPKNYQALADLGVVSTEPAPNNYRRILLGAFYGRIRAEQILAIAKQRGFTDAFIIPATGGKPASATSTPKKPTLANRLSTSSYVVQLAAMRSTEGKNIKDMRKWGTVYYEYAADRDITKILVGPYASEADAQVIATVAKASGYPKAFTRRLTVADLTNIEEVR
ncbi:MAG TPA: hypothetical protein PK239_14915 [Chitinophagales bacterium]|nr:hypothetical protein [Chitinophagales bacterium]HRK28565.1 hypothetical protein [Chitinophagales bacterium]